MKLILAIIRPEKLQALQTALNRTGVGPMTASEVFGYGGQEQGPVQIYRGQTSRRPVTKLRVEIMVHDRFLDAAIATIRAAAFDANSTNDDQLFVMGEAERVGNRRETVESHRSPAAN